MQVSCPVYKGVCITEPDETGYYAPVHQIIGMGGAGCCPTYPPDGNPPYMKVVNKEDHGYMRMWANHTMLIWEFMANGKGPMDAGFLTRG